MLLVCCAVLSACLQTHSPNVMRYDYDADVWWCGDYISHMPCICLCDRVCAHVCLKFMGESIGI